jgi:hypothetical protein
MSEIAAITVSQVEESQSQPTAAGLISATIAKQATSVPLLKCDAFVGKTTDGLPAISLHTTHV